MKRTSDFEKFREMIPGYLKKALDETEQHAFEAAVEKYPQLERDLAQFREIHCYYGDMQRETPRPPDAVYRRVTASIRASEEKRSADRWDVWRDSARQLRRFFCSPRLAWGLAAIQLAVIVVLIGVYPAPHRFKTLTSAPLQVRRGPAVNVVFQPGATEKEIRSLLTALGAVIVNGPTAEGLYTIVLPPHVNSDQVLARLQKDPSVKFAAKAYADGKSPGS